MSERDEPEAFVPPHLQAGVFANDVSVFDDLDYVTLDFIRIDPRDNTQSVVVARVTASRSCIIRLKEELGGAV